jgi:hypothetical protein
VLVGWLAVGGVPQLLGQQGETRTVEVSKDASERTTLEARVDRLDQQIRILLRVLAADSAANAAKEVGLDYERTTFRGGSAGDREPENALIGRFQTLF